MYKVVLVRHGQSQWNLENRFTGWVDVPLSSQGIVEAKEAGQILSQAGFKFDLAYTSVLKRAIKTLWLILEEMDLMWIPVSRNWVLNERHYGNLQGLNKLETAKKYGEEQVHIWRRSYDICPPALKDPSTHPINDPRYANISKEKLPVTECLKDTVERVVPFWENTICPQIKQGKKIIIAAHGNSLRALLKYLDQISDSDITEVNIPTGVPLVYEFDQNLKPQKKYYLGNQDEIKQKVQSVAQQGKKL